jgi:acid phosphatase type 7
MTLIPNLHLFYCSFFSSFCKPIGSQGNWLVRKATKSLLWFCCLFFLQSELGAKTERYRAMWREDPSTTIVIGWQQVSGNTPVLYYDTKDNGVSFEKYAMQKVPDKTVDFKGMKNVFVRLEGLRPNTLYHCIIKDSEGLSRKMSFQTAPNTPETRLSIIAGGDSRNMRETRIKANKLVGKLRPLAVFFGGDMSDSNSTLEWREWLDDWQHSITPEGRLTPIVASLGNHEESPETLINLFDIPSDEAYYALTFGGSLLRLYTLNSFSPPAGEQKTWLKTDLERHNDVLFKIAQYHLPIRPHVLGKESNQEQYIHWAPLFGKYDVKLAIECDAHVAKYTFPIRPSTSDGAVEGFIRDDLHGTVYIGEGGWGAPLRQANRNRNWTRNSESINQFHWLWIDKNKIEVRSVRVECADRVIPSATKNPFELVQGLDLWKPNNGEVVVISRSDAPKQATDPDEETDVEALPKLVAEKGNLEINFTLSEPSEVKVRIMNLRLGELQVISIPKLPAGKNSEIIRFDKVPPGKYVIAIRTPRKLLARYLVIKKS